MKFFSLSERSIIYKNKHLGSVWFRGWKSERIKNRKMMEKLEDRIYFNFLYLCLVGGVEK